VHALAQRQLPNGESQLCAIRGSVEVHCGIGTTLVERLPAVPLADPTRIGTGDLLYYGRQLFLAVGGESAGSRACEVWRYNGAWSPVTTNCFGNPDRTWPGRMAVYDDAVYVGTGGHTTNGIFKIERADGSITDVTPAFYDPGPFGAGLRRVPAAAVAASTLFMGTHVSYLPAGSAEVIRLDGTTWARSSEPGFGSDTNQSTNALAGQDTLLYAGTVNLAGGFEVWRRNFWLFETALETTPGYREFVREASRLRGCLLPWPPSPTCPDRLFVAADLRNVKLAFDTARHPGDDQVLLADIRSRFAQAEKELEEALTLAAAADKVALFDSKAAMALYASSRRQLGGALRSSRDGWHTAVRGTKAWPGGTLPLIVEQSLAAGDSK